MEEKCRVKTHQDAIKSLKELQEYAIQWNDTDMLSVISQIKVFEESQAAKILCLISGKIIESEYCNVFLCSGNVCMCSITIV
jgi:hypothetical protein